MSTPFKAAYNSANQVLNGPGLSSVVYREKGGRGYPQQGDLGNFLLGLLENKEKHNEEAFQKGVRNTEWFKEFVQEHGEEPNLNTPHYNYRKAWAAGVRPDHRSKYDGKLHWGSLNPETGEMLKSEDHPTAWKQHFMELYNVDPDSLDAETVEVLREKKKKRIPQPKGRGFYQQGDFTKGMFSERKAGGGLSNLRESIDINGQPHNLAYINPDEASLLKAMGGSGRKVNGVPAYFGDEADSYTDAEAGVTEDAESATDGPDAAFDPDSGYMGTGQDVADSTAATYSWADEITPEALNEAMGTVWQGMDQTHAQHQARFNKEGFDPWETAYLNAQIAQGKSVAEAQSALSSALASGKGMALQEAFNTGYSYGGPAGTLEGMFEDIALAYSNQLKDVLKPLTKDRKEGIEGLLDNLKGTDREKMQEIIGKWTEGKENINFNPYTGNMHSILGGLAALLPGGGFGQFAGRLLGQNPIGTITIDGKEYTVTASGDIVAETGPVNTAGPFENRRTRRLPTIMKDVIKKDEEEEEEKKSIADLVGPGEDLVESLSLQNLRDLLQGIYGPNYEPFGEEA